MGYINFQNNVTPCNDSNLNAMQIGLMKLVFPIGSTYITQDDTNPSTILNFGTWERIKGKVLVGLDEEDVDFNAIGKTGGEKTHTLTTNEIPEHSHDIWQTSGGTTQSESADALNGATTWSSELANVSGFAKETGGGQAHNNMPPYEVVGYMWIRRA